MSRDNFTKATIDVLAKRVGFLCSNPGCKKATVGPGEKDDKATLIGIAAHITAASPGGPRYDETLKEEKRKHINNGIWLCSNCATLVDKDEDAFSVDLLNKWKNNAEQEMRNALLENPESTKNLTQNPFIEADLIWSHAIRANTGYSIKNQEKFGGNIIPVGGKPIIHWELTWSFSFILHNNSQFPAYNIRIEEGSGIRFSKISKLPKINNIPPFANLDLKAECIQNVESEHTEADELIRQKVPDIIDGLELAIIYYDEQRSEHRTIVRIIGQEIINEK